MANENYETRLVDAMEVAGMHFDEIDSSPDSLRFTSETGIVTYFENWNEVENWIEGTVFDDPEVEQEVDEILHPEKYEDKDKEITVLVVQPEMEPEVRQIGTGLEALQHEVGGMIEVVYPFDDNVGLIMNEEGKLEGLPLNRALRDDDGDIYDIVAGNFFIAGLGDEDFTDLSHELAEKFAEQFKHPEVFARQNGRIVVIPQPLREEQQTQDTMSY